MHQQTLCSAIKDRRQVKLRYDDDLLQRTFAPYVVYWSSKRNLIVAGYQLHNPAEPLETNKWRNLDPDLIRSLTVTDQAFVPDRSFDPLNKRYSGGIICHVFQYAH